MACLFRQRHGRNAQTSFPFGMNLTRAFQLRSNHVTDLYSTGNRKHDGPGQLAHKAPNPARRRKILLPHSHKQILVRFSEMNQSQSFRLSCRD